MASRNWRPASSSTDASAAGNWGGGAPANGDTLNVDRHANSLLEGLAQSAVALAVLRIDQDFTGMIGTRDTPLAIGTASLIIGKSSGPRRGQGSPRINLDLGSATACVAEIEDSASNSGSDEPQPIGIICANAATSIKVRGGKVGIANRSATETSTLGAVEVFDGAECTIAAGVTFSSGTLTVRGGVVIVRSAATIATVRVLGGTVILDMAGAITALTVEGGEVHALNHGTITTLNHYGGFIDWTLSQLARTVTTYNLEPRTGSAPRAMFDTTNLTITNKVAAAAVPMEISARRLSM